MKRAVLVPTTKEVPLAEITLTSDKFLIGRGLTNSHIIEDMSISRHHCILEQKDGGWYITDKSSNGTWLNGNVINKTKSYKLLHGDIFSLSADIKFKYQLRSDNTETNESDQKFLTDVKLNNVEETVLTDAEFVMENLDEVFSSNCSEMPPKTKLDSESISKKKVDNVKQEATLTYAENELQCSICTEMFIKAVTLSCSHTFCKYCITQWQKAQNVCPNCRAEIKMQFSTIVLDNFIDKMIEDGDDELKKRRKALIEEREAVTAGPSTSNTINSRTQPATNLIEISSTDSSDADDESNSDTSHSSNSYVDTDYDDHDDDWDDDYNGLPGHYYGGYGSCYSCGQKGHWSNGCPIKRRR